MASFQELQPLQELTKNCQILIIHYRASPQNNSTTLQQSLYHRQAVRHISSKQISRIHASICRVGYSAIGVRTGQNQHLQIRFHPDASVHRPGGLAVAESRRPLVGRAGRPHLPRRTEQTPAAPSRRLGADAKGARQPANRRKKQMVAGWLRVELTAAPPGNL